ncbi:PAS domain-containing hybrid sensor histidine kinase/response regulator [Chlorobium ferrooxidans]|nr:PAS domain-containing sensor histidine kinase [Chlorobium ferrooxidans]
MNQKRPDSDTLSELCAKAEAGLRNSQDNAVEFSASPEEMRRLIHELTVHQLELNMQHEELFQSRIELEKSLNRYADLYDFAPVGYLTLSRESRIVEGNLTAAKILGVSRSLLPDKYLYNFITAYDRTPFTAFIEQVFTLKGEPSYCEVSLKPKAVQADQLHLATPSSVRMDAVLNDNGENCRLVLTDVTRQQKAEHVISANHERQQLILKETHSGIWEWDIKSNTNVWSDELWPMYGLEQNDLEASYELWKECIEPRERSAVETAVWHAVQQGEDFSIEWRVRNCPDPGRWLMSKGIPYKDQTGEITRYVGIVVDITELKRARQIGIEERLFTKNVIESIPGAYYIIDTNGSYIGWNAFLRDEIVGKPESEMLHTPVGSVLHPEDLPVVQQKIINVIEHGIEEKVEARVLLRGGPEFRWYLLTGKKIIIDGNTCVIGTGIDITEQKQIEEENAQLEMQLVQSQKMEMLGTLAGGIAHDFNNMLGVILGYTEMLLDEFSPADAHYLDIDAIREAAARSAELTQQLLAFARKQTIVPEVFQLNASVEKMLPMLRRLIGENITLHFVPATNKTQIKIDPSQIDQILVNLCVNARDSITGNGQITIKINRCDIAESSSELSKKVVEYLALSVNDDGCGIAKNDIPHIFEPFFTTKEQGKGTGLGLSTIYGIVKQNNGRIDCKSESGIGTTITVYLPLNRDQSASEREEVSDPLTHQGDHTILIVEDEPGILKLCKLMLERKGYRVLVAETPRDAITLADKYNEKIDLLLTDVIMPEMNGQDLSEIILAVRPDIKILFMSGYTADALGGTTNIHTEHHFIRKPFTITSLNNAVFDTLNADNPL